MTRALLAGIAALTLTFSVHAQAPSPAEAAQAAAPMVSADQAFMKAITDRDQAAVANALDPHFEFTNTQGRTFTETEVAQHTPEVTTDAPDPTKVHAYNYGEVGYIQGIAAHAWFLRVWVRRPDGWKIFNYIETAIGPHLPLAPAGGDCVNPCRTIPYTPTTTMDKQILDAWQHAKNDEWHPNAQDWALRVSDEFFIINSGTDRSKAERVEMMTKAQQAGKSGPPGDPIHDIRMYDIGKDAAIMLSKHTPHLGGKPYYNVRVWIRRDHLWQLVASQQTTIQSAPPAH